MEKQINYLISKIPILTRWLSFCKKINSNTSLLVVLLTLAGCSSDTEAQNAEPRIKMGAYYFAGWAGKCPYDNGTPENAWAKGMPTHFTKKLATEFAGREPIWGWRDDTQALMERQIDLAANNGIAYFSFCWYWGDNKGPINVPSIEKDSKHLPMYMFMNAKNNPKMEFCLLVANHAGAEIVGTAAWKQAADFWITKYFKHPRYLLMDGKPVIVIFSSKGGDAEGFKYLQEAARKAGFPGVEIACCGNGNVADGYSVRTHYNIVPGYGKPSEKHQYPELVDAHVKQWQGSKSQPYIPVATVGWDRRPWEAPDGFGSGVEPSWYFEGNTPEAFRGFLEKMTGWMDTHPEQVTKDRLAMLYAWNEIGEGGWLVPCKDDPDGAYLKMVQKVVLDK